MDNAKIFLAKLKKYHFWLLSGLIVLLGLAAWLMAAMDMSARTDKRAKVVKQVFTEVKEVAADPKPENATTVDAIKSSQDVLAESVYQAWDFLYAAQSQRNPWPQDLPPRFLSFVPARKPGSSFPQEYCQDYYYFIRNHLPKLREIIDIRLPAEEKAALQNRIAGGASVLAVSKKKSPAAKGDAKTGSEKGDKKKDAKTSVSEAEQPPVGKVVWREDDIRQLELQYEWPAMPSAAEIWVAQENLWVCEALLRIVAETNSDAPSFYSAPIKEIITLGIAQQAAGGTSSAGGGYASMMAAMSGAAGKTSATPSGTAGPTGSGQSLAGGASDSSSASAKESRYVDTKGQPLTGTAEPPFAEFNMMPVRLVLYMDYRKVPRLLAKCANSSMPVEVRRITLFPADSSGGGSGPGSGGVPGPGGAGGMGMMKMAPTGAGTGGGGPSPADMMKMMGGGGAKGGAGGKTAGGVPGGASMGLGGGATTSTGEPLGPYDMRVEVQGIIFIFNQPDKARLGKGAASLAIAAGKTDAGTDGKPPTAAATAAKAAAPAAAAPASPAGTTPASVTPAAAPASPTTPTDKPTPAAAPPATATPPAAPAGKPAPAAPATN